MFPLYDVYVLSPDRSAETAQRFIDAFAPQSDQTSAEYEFPQYSERPPLILKAAEAIHHCELHASETQAFYFRNFGSDPEFAMLFFTLDGGLILGLSVTEHEYEWFARLKEFAGSDVGYITVETPPAATVDTFRELSASVA